MKRFLIIILIPIHLFAQPFSKDEITRWGKQAKNVTIIRDNWGIPHVYGKTDADAVFGLMYAQCEDDFKRIEMNYIEKLGRMAEVKGESSLNDDLYLRLLLDSAESVTDYNKSPAWLKKLLQAHADGINYFLYKNPQVRPALLNRFKPWYQLLWTDGSIGAISTGGVTEREVGNFYNASNAPVTASIPSKQESTDGSNGFAIAPSRTELGNSILYINPHTTYYFRPEVQMVSEEGLQVYGAVTWGQFFVYQGFNPHCGWMHTSSDVDVADLYELKLVKKNDDLFYEYNNILKPVKKKAILLRYKKGESMQGKVITAYYTHHGPVMAERNGKWISVRSYNRSLNGLMQCWLRNKAKGIEDYKKVMELRGNTSNNTVFADNKGNIAYWHGNYVPKRNPKYDWSKSLDGSLAATDWEGVHTVNETVHVINPANGWIQNCNSTPFTVAGANSPKRENYPLYMAPDGENFRGINAVNVLSRESKFTLDKIIEAGYDTKLTALEILVPALIKAFDNYPVKTDSLYTELLDPVNELRSWNYYSAENSVASTLGIEWVQKLNSALQRVYVDAGEADQVSKTKQFALTAKPEYLLPPLLSVKKELVSKFGKWRVPWGELNRYQRLTGELVEKYDDTQPSLPVGFAASTWGCLPSFVSRSMQGTQKRYGYNGNSFVCAVEFGKRVKARSVLSGGVSGDPKSKHFADQASLFTKGQFKDVLFYKEDVLKHVERSYRPGY